MAKKKKNQDTVETVETPAVPFTAADHQHADPPHGIPTDMVRQEVAVGPDIPPEATIPSPSEQVAQAWTHMLAMSTAQGASRADIIGMTLHTALSVVDMTAQALWPEGSDIPKSETQAFAHTMAVVHTTREALEKFQG